MTSIDQLSRLNSRNSHPPEPPLLCWGVGSPKLHVLNEKGVLLPGRACSQTFPSPVPAHTKVQVMCKFFRSSTGQTFAALIMSQKAKPTVWFCHVPATGTYIEDPDLASMCTVEAPSALPALYQLGLGRLHEFDKTTQDITKWLQTTETICSNP